LKEGSAVGDGGIKPHYSNPTTLHHLLHHPKKKALANIFARA